jgi:hypothetical protein
MMVVIAILGVLTGLALVYLRPQPKTLDIANRVGDLVEETTRRAVALGPVRADVVTAARTGGATTTAARARTRLSATGTSGQAITFTLDVFTENALPAATGTWTTVETYTTDSSVAGIAWASGVGSHTALASALQTTWTTFHANCDPDGTCEAHSLFFQNLHDGSGNANYQARLSILPLGGATMTRADWN